ncbi:MAG: Hpt domain-containing protein [Rhodocyclales bacterium]|nr:Hpt domain-containing protein [Rhodocyclales bacterium]
MTHATELDLGPLTWVKGEIDQALTRAAEALATATSSAEALSHIQFAQTHLHQASGALSIVGLDGLTQFAQSLDQFLGVLARGERPADATAMGIANRGIAAIGNYLEELVRGTVDQPMRLLPLYLEIGAARGASNVSGVDLFFPDLSLRPGRKSTAASRSTEQSQVQHRVLRAQFERGLLQWLRKPADRAAAKALRDAARNMEALLANPASAALWAAATAFLDALVYQDLAADPQIIKVCAMLHKELRQSPISTRAAPERLLRHLLFWVSQAPARTAEQTAVRTAWALDALVPEPGSIVTETPIAPLLKSLHADLGAIKRSWDEFSAGQAAALPRIESGLSALATSVGQLKRPTFDRLLDGMRDFIKWLHKDPLQFNDAVALEFATALLLAEVSLDRGVPESGFAAQVADTLERLGALTRGEMVAAAEHSPTVETARRLQEREARAQVSREMQWNLAQVEQTLDDFFRNQEKRAPLAALAKPLKQIEGALAMMGDDQAITLIRNAGSTVARFAESTQPAESGEFEQLAQRLSALGLYIQALQHGDANLDRYLNPEQPRTVAQQEPERIIHGPTATVLNAPVELQPASTEIQFEPDYPSISDSSSPVAVEVTAWADTLVGEDDNLGADHEESQALAAPVEIPPLAPRPPVVVDAEAIDAELLDIFIEEAHEVLATIAEQQALSLSGSHSAEPLIGIRRAFHTLKGSGRMVGLNELGEAAWGLEQTLNRWLQLEWSFTPPLHALIKSAHQQFSDWVVQIEGGQGHGHDVSTLLAEAERLRQIDTPDQVDVTVAPAELEVTPPEVAATPVVEAEQAEPASAETGIEELALDLDLDESAATAAAAAVAENEFGSRVSHTPADAELDEDASLSTTVLTMPNLAEPEESDELVISLDHLDEAEAEAEPTAQSQVDYADEGVKVDEITIAALPEDDLDALVIEDQASDFDDTGSPSETETVLFDIRELPTAELPAETPAEIVEQEPSVAETEAAAGEFGAPPPDSGEEEQPSDVDVVEALAAPTSVDVDVDEGQEAASAEVIVLYDEPPESESPYVRLGDTEISRPLFDLYLAEARTHIETLHDELGQLKRNPLRTPSESALRASHTLAGISGTARATPVHQLARALEHAIECLRELAMAPEPEQTDLLCATVDELEAMLAEVAECKLPLPAPELELQLAGVGRQVNDDWGTPPPDDTAASKPISLDEEVVLPPAETVEAEPAPAVHDDLDEQLLPIFLEEGTELVSELHSSLRTWKDSPADGEHTKPIARLLHTLKGSARMAGAMRLGEHVHQMESRLESALQTNALSSRLIDELVGGLDVSEQMLRALSGAEAPLEAGPAPTTADTTGATAAPAVAVEGGIPAPEAATGTATLRVRADMVDRFVNEAGEIGIARTRIEGELRTLRRAMLDLTENVIRLRNQLREVEIQAEMQMQSRIAQAESLHAEFDPLEMDRYTRLQELTRMMAESVGDVTTVQQSLLRNLDGAELALHSQARLSRDLQQNLMQVRMVQFDSLADRLHRVVRQSAKELGKRANLDIRGGRIEVDRSVLEHMTAPLEHLLRNAVAHGIEAPEQRRASGKDEFGQITLTVSHEGNEIAIVLADDGVGLNYAAIAERARERGLLEPDETADEKRLINLIFVPGFSTANTLSAVSGRGIGMDVVKAEAAAVGGRIDVHATAGKGAEFRIYLPLTLAVTQALLVRAAERSYAIPSNMISQVVELKADALDKVRADGGIEWQDRFYPYAYLPHLLGNHGAEHEVQRFNWVLLLRSGAQTLALLIDSLRGNQEIVVKNAGPQLVRIAGISGATLLGDGEILLILNPVVLASRGVGETLAGETPAATTPLPEKAEVHQPTVLVVDDSLTVRKITSRLLEREGYRVITAKDGSDALEKLLDTIPDVILSDIEMPRMDGFDLVRNIRADERTRDVPVIMITSRLAEKHRQYAEKVGANHYLGKPFDEDELLKLLHQYTGRVVDRRAVPR